MLILKVIFLGPSAGAAAAGIALAFSLSLSLSPRVLRGSIYF